MPTSPALALSLPGCGLPVGAGDWLCAVHDAPTALFPAPIGSKRLVADRGEDMSAVVVVVLLLLTDGHRPAATDAPGREAVMIIAAMFNARAQPWDDAKSFQLLVSAVAVTLSSCSTRTGSGPPGTQGQSTMHSDDFRFITGSQLRAARALVRWSDDKLAESSQVALATIAQAEAADGPVSVMAAEVRALRLALERAGVVFIPENGGGVGVRLAKRSGKPDEGLRPEQLSSDNDG
jgi:hypothetical protein